MSVLGQTRRSAPTLCLCEKLFNFFLLFAFFAVKNKTKSQCGASKWIASSQTAAPRNDGWADLTTNLE